VNERKNLLVRDVKHARVISLFSQIVKVIFLKCGVAGSLETSFADIDSTVEVYLALLSKEGGTAKSRLKAISSYMASLIQCPVAKVNETCTACEDIELNVGNQSFLTCL
jgi:hypothetical protein